MTSILAIIGAWASLNLLACCWAGTDSEWQRSAIVALGVLVILSCAVFVVASLFPTSGITGPNMVNR